MIEVEERFPSTEGLVSDAEGLAAAQALIEEAHRHKRIRRRRIIVGLVVVAVVGSLVVVSQVSSGRHLSFGGQPPKTAPAPVFVESGSPWGPPQQITSGAGAVWVTMSAPTKPGQPPAPSAMGGIVRIGLAEPTRRHEMGFGCRSPSVDCGQRFDLDGRIRHRLRHSD